MKLIITKCLLFVVVSTIAVLFLASCGSTETDCLGACCSSPAVGVWENDDDMISIYPDCGFDGYYCDSEGVTTPMDNNLTGTGILIIKESNEKAGCLPLGENSCQYEVSNNNNTLSFICGGFGGIYQLYVSGDE